MLFLDWDYVELSEYLQLYSAVSVLATLLLLALYLLYYLMFMVNRPLLVGGGGSLKQHLLSHCPSLQQYYWPTVWAFNCHLRTVLQDLMQRDIKVEYRRTILTLVDGGQVSLDWAESSEQSKKPISEDAPIMLILAGLTGCSESIYIKYLCVDGLTSGYRPVVFNQRGTGGVILKTPRMYCATKIDDLQHALKTIRLSYPSSGIVGVGACYGGVILTQYLHQTGCHGDFKAVLVISLTWDFRMSLSSAERNVFRRLAYSQYMCYCMKRLLIRNTSAMSEEVLKMLPYDLEHVLKSTGYYELDERMTCPLFGYDSADDYYKASSTWDKVHKIQTPFLCLASEDDPVVPTASIPFKGCASNPHTVLAVTSHGGHFGYPEGLLPTSQSWSNRVCREFLVAMAHYKQ